MSQFQHLTLNQVAHDTVLLRLNVKDSETNTLSLAVLKEINEAVGGITDQGFKGLVISSAKSDYFTQGAGIEVLLNLSNKQATEAYISLGNQVCRRIRELPFPTVALIENTCCNEGWDIALSCQYRVASIGTRVVYSHYQHGFYAGFGGITRLISFTGLSRTLDLLSTETHTADALHTAGLISHCVPEYQLQAVLERLFQKHRESEGAELGTNKPHHSNNWLLRQVQQLSFKKQSPFIANSPSEKQASSSIIKTWHEHNISNDSYLAEAKAATELLHSSITQNHLRFQRLKQTLKTNASTKTVGRYRVHIIGCGSMGRYLARLCAQSNCVVTLTDTRHSALEKFLPELYQYFDEHKVPHALRQKITDNINLSQESNGLAHADIILEATPESYLAKASLLKEIEANAKSTALLLTSSACLPLADLSKNMQNPARLALFNPHHSCFNSDLVEISTPENNQSLASIKAFASVLSLIPIQVKSATGYLGTRLMMAFLNESMLIHQSGTSVTAIDRQALKMGMSFPPFELIDELGITECLRVAEALADRRGIDVPNVLIQKYEQGLLGKRSGSGFYRYKNGIKQERLLNNKISPSNRKLRAAAIEQRLMEKIINEARACMKEGIIDDESILDLLATTTTGFPMQHGGPLNYLKELQAANKTLTK